MLLILRLSLIDVFGVYIWEPGHEDIFQGSGVLCLIY
jgi:hypothetical protein